MLKIVLPIILTLLLIGCGDDDKKEISNNPCQDIICGGYGTCVVTNNSASCNCNLGYHAEELNCVINQPCDGVTCSENGTCIADGDTASCSCNPGYHTEGLNCIKNSIIDPCEGISCGDHGSCIENGDNPSCSCENGYHLSGLDCVKDVVTGPCSGIDCGGTGICSVVNDTPLCICNSGYHDRDNDLICSKNYETLTAGGTDYESGSAIAIDSDNNRWVVGEFSDQLSLLGCNNTLTGTGSINSGFIAKIDSNNRCTKLIQLSASEYLFPADIVTDKIGNIYITGYFEGTATLGTNITESSNEGSALFLIALNNEGELQNHLVITDIGDQYGISLFHHDNALYLGGSFQGDVTFGSIAKSSEGGGDMFVAKMSNTLITEWVYTAGSIYDDITKDLFVTDQGIYLAGEFSGTVNFSAGDGFDKKTALAKDGVILKLNHSGISQWSRIIGGDLDDYLDGIVVDSQEQITVAGSFIDILDMNWDNPDNVILIAENQYDIFLTRITTDGNYIDTKIFEGTAEDDWVRDLIINDDNIYITGSYNDVLDFNPFLGDDQEDYRITEGEDDIFIAVLNGNQYSATYTFGEDLSDSGFGIAVDQFGMIVATGGWQNSANFSPIEGSSDEISSAGGRDLYIWSYFPE